MLNKPGDPPRSQQTIFPRTHVREKPLNPEELEAARAVEAERKRWDRDYIDAATARSIPAEVLEKKPELRQRIKYSQPDWPEGRMSATEALGPLEGGAGEVVEQRNVDAAELFTGKRVDGASSGS